MAKKDPPRKEAEAAAKPAETLPETPAAAQLRRDGHALLAALAQFNTTLRAQSVALTDEERRSGVGKLLANEASQLAIVARYAADHPELVKGLAAKDGGQDPSRFEAEVLLDHLSVHQAARDVVAAFDKESDALHTLLGDLAIHRGALARPPLLAAYRVFATLAEHDVDVRHALRSVQEFYDRSPKQPEEKVPQG